jgi:hypothetical protein
MKRFLFPLLIIALLGLVAPVQAQPVYLGMYWISGNVLDADSKGTEGRQVVFYK